MKDETLLPENFSAAIVKLKNTLVACNRYNYCSDAIKDIEDAFRCALQSANSAQPVTVPDDTRRMDWLVSKTVNVREPLVCGSHDLFWSQTISDDWEEEHKTTLREQIDAAMAAAPKVKP